MKKIVILPGVLLVSFSMAFSDPKEVGSPGDVPARVTEKAPEENKKQTLIDVLKNMNTNLQKLYDVVKSIEKQVQDFNDRVSLIEEKVGLGASEEESLLDDSEDVNLDDLEDSAVSPVRPKSKRSQNASPVGPESKRSKSAPPVRPQSASATTLIERLRRNNSGG